MTAEEIRSKQFTNDDGSWETADWTREIAAQLATLNELLRIAMRKMGWLK